MQLLTATLTKPARQVTTKYGIRTVADVIDQNGNTQTIWRPENDPALVNLAVNSRLTLTLDSKGKINLVDNAPTAIATKTEPNNHKFDKAQKQEIASYIGQQKELLQFCWKEASMI